MSEQTQLSRLAAAVDASVEELEAFAQLEERDLAILAEGFEHAQTRQRAELEHGIEEAISYVPAIMRRPVLRILRGKED